MTRPAPRSPAWRVLLDTLPRPRPRLRPPAILRAVPLEVRRTGPAEARVTGGAAPHRVTWNGDAYRCDCLAATYHPRRDCKHVLAVRLRRGDRTAWAALREEVGA